MRLKFHVFAVLAVLLTCPFLSAQVTSEDLSGPSWSAWRGPNGNSMVKDSVSPAAITNSRVLWTLNVGPGYTAVQAVGKVAFTCGRLGGAETLFCVNIADGKILWQYKVGGASGDFPGTRASPLVIDGKVYCMNRDGLVYCLNTADGSLVWQSPVARETGAAKPQWGFTSSPVRLGELLLLNIGETGTAIRIADGKVVWKSGPSTAGYASFVPFEYQSKTLAAVFGSVSMSVVEAATGKVLATVPWRTNYDVNVADPLVVGNQILVTSAYGRGAALFAFDGASLNKVWESKVIKSHFSSLVQVDGTVYGNDGDVNAGQGDWVCFDYATGKEYWREKADVGSLIAADRNLVMLNQYGRLSLVAISPQKYTELASIQRVGAGSFWSAPTLAGGKLFVRNNNGMVSCIELGN